jgi:hypothetical protein
LYLHLFLSSCEFIRHESIVIMQLLVFVLKQNYLICEFDQLIGLFLIMFTILLDSLQLLFKRFNPFSLVVCKSFLDFTRRVLVMWVVCQFGS